MERYIPVVQTRPKPLRVLLLWLAVGGGPHDLAKFSYIYDPPIYDIASGCTVARGTKTDARLTSDYKIQEWLRPVIGG